jgi:hypothetical protein
MHTDGHRSGAEGAGTATAIGVSGGPAQMLPVLGSRTEDEESRPADRLLTEVG